MNISATKSTEREKQMSDKALIAKLKYELEECQTSNMRLQKINIWQEQTIERQSEMIEQISVSGMV